MKNQNTAQPETAPVTAHTPTARHIELAEAICPLSSTSSMQVWRAQWVKDSAQLMAESDAALISERDRLRDALEYYSHAPWAANRTGVWHSSDLAKVANEALANTTPSESARLREINVELITVSTAMRDAYLSEDTSPHEWRDLLANLSTALKKAKDAQG